MIGTCSSKPSALRYGTMRSHVGNLEVVLDDGTLLLSGQRAIKSVAVYDLNALFCGHEDPLGIMTKVTYVQLLILQQLHQSEDIHRLRKRALPKHSEIAQASFDNLTATERCVPDINARGPGLAAFEYLDPAVLACCKKYDGKVDLVLDNQVILFKFVVASRHRVESDIRVRQSHRGQAHGVPFQVDHGRGVARAAVEGAQDGALGVQAHQRGQGFAHHRRGGDDRFRLGTNEDTELHTLFCANIPTDVEEFNTWLQRINDADVANVYFISKGNS